MRDQLRQIPFFSALSNNELDAVANCLQRRHYGKGDVVFAVGDPGDSMYVIESGLVKVISEQSGEERFILYLGPGNFFGEGAALFGGNHSASVYVAIDAEILMLRRHDLIALLNDHPQLYLSIIRELHQRLRHSLRSPIQPKEMTVIAVIGDNAPILAEQLAQVTGEDVCMFDFGNHGHHPLDRHALAQSNVYYHYADGSIPPDQLPVRLSALLRQYYWVVLWIPPVESPITKKVLDQADLRVIIGSAFLFEGIRLTPRSRLYADDSIPSIHRLARRIARRQVGVALSSGNARGIAHIGVLQVLAEENIPIDMIAGTSAGSLFGAMYATGKSLDEMIKFALTVEHEFNPLTGIRNWDFSFPPRSGLIKGDAFLKRIRELIEDKSFSETDIPLAVVTVDLVSGDEIVFDQGPIADAVRASMSVGGLLEPAQVEGRFLIDGGAINPVPTRALVDHGMNLVIASNVIPNLQDRLRRWRLQREKRLPHLFDIVFSEREIMEAEIVRSSTHPPNVFILPDVARFDLRDYKKAREIIRAGEDATRAKIDEIRQMVSPRPRKATGSVL
jgi:NTE family protein